MLHPLPARIPFSPLLVQLGGSAGLIGESQNGRLENVNGLILAGADVNFRDRVRMSLGMALGCPQLMKLWAVFRTHFHHALLALPVVPGVVEYPILMDE